MPHEDVADKIARGKYALLIDEHNLAWAIVGIVSGGNRSLRPVRLRHAYNRYEDLDNFTQESMDSLGNAFMTVMSVHVVAVFDTEDEALAASEIIGAAFVHYMATTQPARDVFLVTAKLMA